MNKAIRIVAAVVDVRQLTLYVEDGSTIVILQGDPRLRKIVNEATPQLLEKGWADVVIGPAEENSYAQFEQEGSGAVKFFRIAKAKLKNLFTPVVEEPKVDYPVIALSIGQVPQPAPTATPAVTVVSPLLVKEIAEAFNEHESTLAPAPPAAEVVEDDVADEGADEQEEKPVIAKLEQTQNAIDEIMKHAVPVSSPVFDEKKVAKQGNVVENNGETIKAHNDNDDSEDTIIAVVDNKIIPGMERIKTQFSRAAKMGSTEGVENFLRRIANVIEKRSHSIDDLLKFMERGDLPIADDGSILIYKVLKRFGSRTDGKYVDCHTKKVEQWTGAYVCMDEKLVDHNRNNECSNGLHVARRGYIGQFYGDVCVLAKLAPEDVIAVPSYDANKMRVCGYHILMELSDRQYQLVKANRPMSEDEEGKRLLAAALAGKHVRRTHEVRITQQSGNGVVVKEITQQEAPKVVVTKDAPVEVVALENLEKETLDVHTSPLEVIEKVEAVQLSRKEQAKALYDACVFGGQEAIDALHAFKKASKTSWEKLGLPDLIGNTFRIRAQTIEKGLPQGSKTPAMPKVAKPKKKAHKAPKKGKAKSKVKQAPKVKTQPQVAVVEMDGSEDRRGLVYDSPAPTGVTEGSPRQRVQKLIHQKIKTKEQAELALSIKKASKKSWEYLGVSDEQVASIMKLSGQ